MVAVISSAAGLSNIPPPSTEVTPLSDHVVFNDERLARKYASEPIPISTLYEAYFDEAIDVPGDLVSFLRQRASFVKHKITRQHLQWALTNFVPEMVAHSKDADARSARELFDDRGVDFYRAFLGESLSFSCGHFFNDSDTLDTATRQSYELVAEQLRWRPGHRVLELGCDWGSLLSYGAANRGIAGLGLSPSKSQVQYANEHFGASGVSGAVQARFGDYRDVPEERFDSVVCLEMVERVGLKNLKSFFEALHHCLEPDGTLLLQYTGLRRQLRPEDLMWGLFMNKYIFPGADAALPLSSMLKVAEKSGWEVQSVQNRSRHYLRTLRRWRTNWVANERAVQERYGVRWYRIWLFFLAWSELVGEQGSAACFQITLKRNLDTLDRATLAALPAGSSVEALSAGAGGASESVPA